MRKKSLLLTSLITASFFAKAQNVGIGTTAPVARLHVTDSAVLFSGATTVPPVSTTINPPVQAAGTRMLWFPALGAFRAGYVNGVQWNRDNIGQLSFASGYNTVASGRVSTAMGYNSTASGDSSTAFGILTTASGNTSTAMGYFTAATSNFSTAMGIGSAATGYASTAMGYSTTAGGSFSTSLGNISNASGTVSLAVGEHTLAKAYGSVAMGMYNDSADAPSATVPDATDRIFQIGNGNGPGSGRSNAVTVLRNGNMGIGITSPLAKLDMRGQILLRGNGFQSGAPAVFLTNINGDEYRGKLGKHPTNDSLIGLWGFYAPNNGWALNMNIYNGRIGIGKDNPLALLQISGTSSYSNPDLWLNSAGIANSNTIRFSGPAAQGVGWGMTSYTHPDYNSTSNQFWLYRIIDSTGGYIQPVMLIQKDGNIGIGNVIANGKLQFENTAFNRKIVLWEAANNDHQFYGFGINGFTLRYQTPSSTDDHVFYSGAGTNTSTELMRIKGSGLVGVGVSDPVFKLDVGGRMRIRSVSGGFTAGLWLNNDANNASPAFFGMKADNEVGFYGQTGTEGWRFWVNTTTGNATLAGTLTQLSDMRLKKNIQPIRNTLSQISQLNGYTYNWKDENAEPVLQIGLLAQEIQEIYPQLVKENNKGILSVNYSGMIPVLLEAIKEQQQEIAELKFLLKQIIEKNKLSK